jgi:Zn-dependent peptidase ImmA (M78 family)
LGTQDSSLREPSTQLIHTAVRYLSAEEKGKIIEYLYQLTGSTRFGGFPVLDGPAAYAEYVLRHLKYTTLPIDPFEVARRLNIPVIYSSTPLPYEGMLCKALPEPTIILDTAIDHSARYRFTVAMLLGHLIIPWHMRPVFTRDKGKHSLEQENPLAMEAQEFAGELMIPSKAVAQEFSEKNVTLEAIEQIADTKFKCSMTSFIHKFNARHNKITAFITSKDGIPTRRFTTGCPYTIVERAGEGSLVHNFITNPPMEKEYRKGFVDAAAWVQDPPAKLKVYEESLLDPKYGVAVTLLKFSL